MNATVTMTIYLSYPLDPADPRPPAIPAPELIPLYTIEKDGASVHTLKIASHTGTHVDTPAHVIAGRRVTHGVAVDRKHLACGHSGR